VRHGRLQMLGLSAVADEEALNLLKQGPAAWNEQRKLGKFGEADFRKADLGGANLRRANLSWADLSMANLRRAKLSEREDRENRTVLFPIRIDEAVMDAPQQWAAEIRSTRHTGDFSNWKDHDFYLKAFDRLLLDLQASA